MSKLKPISFKDLGGDVWRLLRFPEEADKRWSAFNPSIAYSPVEGYVVLFRSSNYFLDPETTSAVITVGSWVRSRMWLGSLDADWQLIPGSLREVDFSDCGIRIKRGPEDGRLYWRDGTWEITAGLYEPGIELPRIAKFKLDGLKAKLVEIYQDGELFQVEKNWTTTNTPNDKFDFIYTSVDIYKKGVGPVRLREPNESVRHVRGGSQLWELENGEYLSVIHEADIKSVKINIPRMFTFKDIFVRTYVHRFAKYDSSGKLIGLSPRFKFSDARIEFAAGLVVAGDEIIVSYGYKDVVAYLGKIKLDVVLKSIKEV